MVRDLSSSVPYANVNIVSPLIDQGSDLRTFVRSCINVIVVSQFVIFFQSLLV